MAREYKDSGIEWIGQIPKEWNINRLKFLCTIQTGNKDTQDATADGIYPFYVRSPKIEFSETYSFEGEGILMAGDGVGAGRVFHHAFGKYAVHQRVYRLANIRRINSVYLFYYLSNLFCKEMDRGSAQSTVPSVRLPMLQNFMISTPPLSEQQKIADYLDKVCGEVDEMIVLQEKMIEELKAYKQSVITEAVTKGLNPNVPMKDSGIDWIGEIPEHWAVCRIKDLVHTQSGRNLTTNEIMPTGIYPVYGGNGIRGYYSDYSNDGNYILIGRQGALCGNINYAQGKFWATEHAVVCYPKYDFEIIWLGELLRAMNLGQYSLSAAQPGLAVERIRNLEMPFPPRLEQQQIASYLNTKCSDIDSMIAVKQQKIEELKEYKKSIIYEYVTGKKEVI
jgi:type I restriction enzyme S subunit